MFTDLRIPAGRRPLTRGEALASTILTVAFTLLIGAAILDEYTPKKLGIVFFFAWWVPMLILHEAGHAIMAKALGWRVREIVIGFGRDLWHWQLGETRIRVKLAPLEGYVLPAPAAKGKVRLKSSLIYFAGPGAELALLLIMLAVFGWDGVFNDSDQIGDIALQSLAVVILLGAGFNLIPFRTDGGVSDGLGILSSPFMSDESIELRLMTFDLREYQRLLHAAETDAALQLIEDLIERYPGNPSLQFLYVAALSADKQTEKAREYAREKLDDASSADADRLAWLAQQARIELEADEPSWLVLDLAMQKCLAASPLAPALLALRGASLVRRGDYENGGNLLADAWRRNDGSADDAEILAYLALAARKIGAGEAAAHFRNSFEQVNRSRLLANRVKLAA